MGATCAGHVTERAKASTTVLAQEDDGNNLRQLPLGGPRFPNRHPPDDVSVALGLPLFDGFLQCQVRYRASILR